MDNKELPQEIRDRLNNYAFRENEVKNVAFRGIATIGAQIAHSHYLKELQAKDTTIKNQAEKIEKLTGLLKEKVVGGYSVRIEERWQSYKEQHGI